MYWQQSLKSLGLEREGGRVCVCWPTTVSYEQTLLYLATNGDV